MSKHIVLATALNVRASPRATSDSTVLGVLPFGSVIEELDADADRSWLRIRVGMLEGWASNMYLLRDEAYQSFPWVVQAVREFGVAEVAGVAVNRRIQAYLSTVGAGSKNDDTTAWCSAFAKWCVIQARASNDVIPVPNKITSGARSWHTSNWSKEVTNNAPLGSVVVLWRRRDAEEGDPKEASRTPAQVKREGTGGHVGFLAEPFSANDAFVTLLGGNQSNQVCKSSYPLGKDYGLLSIRGLA